MPKSEIRIEFPVIDTSKLDEQLRLLRERLASLELNTNNVFAQLHSQQQEAEARMLELRWGTDPLGLMDWLTVRQWRWSTAQLLYRISRGFGAAQDLFWALSNWVEPED
jgi:hypothetical protein